MLIDFCFVFVSGLFMDCLHKIYRV